MAPGAYSSATAVIIANIALTATTALVVLLRLSYRLLVTRNLGVDDALITIALLCSITQGVASCYEAHYAIGVHTWLVTQRESVLSQKALWVAILTYNSTLFTGRLSILFQYRRVFIQKWFRVCLYVLMAVVGLFGVETVLGSILACIPVSKYWNDSEPGHCQPRYTVWYINGGITIVTDIAIAVLPLPILARLHVPKAKRAAIMIIFALGGITCVITGIRQYFLWAFASSSDPLYNNGPIAIWSTAEINTILIMACLPVLKGVYTRVFYGSKASGSSTSSPPHDQPKEVKEIISNEHYYNERYYRSDSEMTAVPSTVSQGADHTRQDRGLVDPSTTADFGDRSSGSPDSLQKRDSLRPAAPEQRRSWRESIPRLGSDIIARLSPMPSVGQATRMSDLPASDRVPMSRDRLVSTQGSGVTCLADR